MHIGGRFWHPKGGSENPGDNTDVIIHHGNSALAVKWVPVRASDLTLVNLQNPAITGGRWEFIYYILNPHTSSERTVSAEVGMDKVATSVLDPIIA